MEHNVPGISFAYPNNKQVDHNRANLPHKKCKPLNTDINWIISNSLVNYQESCNAMIDLRSDIKNNTRKETVWLLEHPDIYSRGKMASELEVISNDQNFPVIATSRGGKTTYHGPGQRICYLMLNIRKRNIDVRSFIWLIEELIIKVLANFSVHGFRKEGLRGIFVQTPSECKHKKIAAIGINISNGISTHGFSLNNNIDLNNYRNIIPCGIQKHGVTSLFDIGVHIHSDALDLAIQTAFYSIFT